MLRCNSGHSPSIVSLKVQLPEEQNVTVIQKDDLCGSGNSKRSFFEFVVTLEILQEEEILVGFFSSVGAKVLAGHVFERMTL